MDHLISSLSSNTEEYFFRIVSAVMNLNSIGVSPDDVDPEYLPFESTSYDNCIDLAEDTFDSSANIDMAVVACFRRYYGPLKNDDAKPKRNTVIEE